MNKDLLVKLVNSDDLKRDISALSIDDRCDILLYRYASLLNETLLERLIEEKIILISKEESEKLLNENKYYNGFLLGYGIQQLLDYSDSWKEYAKEAISVNPDAIYILDDPVEYLQHEFYEWKKFPDPVLDRIIQSGKFNAIREDLIYNFKSDEYKLKYIDTLRLSDRIYLITTFESDELKASYLSKVKPIDKPKIISSFKSDEFKEKYTTTTTYEKGTVIASFKSDEAKNRYLNRFKLLLSGYELGEIIASFEDMEYIRRNLGSLRTTKALESFLVYFDVKKNRELYLELLSHVKDDHILNDVFSKNYNDPEIQTIAINKMQRKRELMDIIEYYGRYLNVEMADIIGSKLSSKDIEQAIADNKEHSNFELLVYCENEDLIIEALRHNATLNVEYNDKSRRLFEIAAKHYNLNVEHLIALAKLTSCEILKNIENENIKKAINLSDEDFNKYIKLFDKKNYDLNVSSLTSLVTILLNREYRFTNANIIDIFSNTLHFIDAGSIDSARSLMLQVYVGYNQDNYNVELLELEEGVIAKNPKMLEIYNKMTNEYITNDRNNFVNDRLGITLRDCSEYKYEDSEIIKYVFSSLEPELIERLLRGHTVKLNPEENKLFYNRELFRKLIDFRKNPVGKPTDEIKKNLSLFNKICAKAFNEIITKNYQSIEGLTIKYTPALITPDSLIEIMSYINVDKIKSNLLGNDELFKELLAHLDKYDMLGWGDRFTNIFLSSDLSINNDIVASIINNFNFINKIKKEKERDGKQFTLATELEMADYLESNSNIYSLLLGDEDYGLIRSNPPSNRSPMRREDRLRTAIECLHKMHKKRYITVPPIDENVFLSSGKAINLKLGNTNDPINLTYGERTGACMRIGGAGRTLFDFCLNDENGFHISFLDPNTGSFISRVSCYRNGNTLFMNQLRDSVDSNYTNDDVVEACKIIANMIIEKTKESAYPIENVIASNGYALSKEKIEPIGCKDVEEGYKSSFYTDVNPAGAVKVASSGENVPVILGPNKAEKYPIGRSKVKKYEDNRANIAIKRIEALDLLYEGEALEDIIVDEKDLEFAFVGEDWYYAITTDGQVIRFIQKNSLNPEIARAELMQYEASLNKSETEEEGLTL